MSPEEWRNGKRVLCIPGVGQLDEAIALILAQLVSKRGVGARAERSDALSMSRLFTLDTKDVDIACICYIENATSAQMHYAVRRLRRKTPQATIITLLIQDNDETKPAAADELIQRSLEAAVNRIIEIARTRASNGKREPRSLGAA